MPPTSTAISVMPIVDPHVEESPQHRPLHRLRDPDDLRVVGANREAKKGVAMIAWPQIVALRTIATHPLHNLPGGRIRVAKFDPAVLRGSVVVFGDGPMTPDSSESISGDRHDVEVNGRCVGSDDRC